VAVDADLKTFVRDALAGGAARPDIAAVLAKAGWPEADIQKAMAAYADIPFAVPVPRAQPYLSAREAFLYLVLFTTLYYSAWHTGSLIFDLINVAFPDPAFDRYRGTDFSIRWSLASLIVAFPVFLYLSRVTSREVARDPSKRGSKVRRWLTYLTLFASATAIICDLVTLVYNALGGDLTIRFLLKVLTVAVIAGLIFGHYLRDLRKDEHEA
jgi:hypothetical protein